MIASIKMKGKYSVGVNSSGNLKIGNTQLNIKDIPFVRYSFDTYGQEEIEFIRSDRQKYKYSTTLIEFMLADDIAEQLGAVEEGVDNAAKFVYIEVDDEVVENSCFDEEIEQLLMETTEYTVDSYCLIDKSSTLDMLTFRKLANEVADLTGIDIDKVGVCMSPLSFSEYACLTAVKAREIMAEYSTVEDVPLPSANHQKGGCGCIQYVVVSQDYEAPAEKVKKTSANTEKKEATSSKPKSAKKSKPALTMGRFKF